MDYTDVERFRTITGFPRYDISNYGRVMNTHTGRDMKFSPTVHGDLTVGLTYQGKQYRRSVKVLVAQTFVPGWTDRFNTPILLDGESDNLRADNIVWRPRWFACMYTRQFDDPPTWFFSAYVIETTSGKYYKNIMEASMENGILCKDIRRSILNGHKVFPTGDQYIYRSD